MALTDNLVSYWKLDESSGDAADSVGSNTLTNTGVAYTTGKINNGADFERSDTTDVLSITDAAQSGLDFTTAFTLAGWVIFESFPGAGEIWEFAGKVNSINVDMSYSFGYRQDGGAQGLFFAETSDGNNGATGKNDLVSWTPSTATPYHVTAVYDGSQGTAANRVRYFVNASGSYASESWHSSIFSGGATFRLGNSGVAGRAFDGVLDEWGAWSRALSDAEITELYNGGAGLSYPFAAAATAFPRKALLGVGQ